MDGTKPVGNQDRVPSLCGRAGQFLTFKGHGRLPGDAVAEKELEVGVCANRDLLGAAVDTALGDVLARQCVVHGGEE